MKTLNMIPGYTPIEMLQTAWQFAFQQTRLQFSMESKDIFIMALAQRCHEEGLDEEFAVKRLLHVTPFWQYEVLVRKTFHNLYESHKAVPQAEYKAIPYHTMQMEMMKDFLRRRYRFRRNGIVGGEEYVERGSYAEVLKTPAANSDQWKPLTKAVLNTITLQALGEGIQVWDKDVRRYVESTLVEEYDPIADWLNALPEWDGNDHVGAFARRLPTDNPDWTDNFRLWLRSMVAGWLMAKPLHGNATVPLIIGAQGDGKSTFCRMILPEELRTYYTDRIDFTNRNEAEKALTRFALINLDEYDSMTKRQNAFLKHILQKADVKTRKLYESIIQQRKRYAAFIGTTNDPTPLTDLTGSRRFMCVQTSGPIDTKGVVDYQQLYAQVVHEIRHGCQTWFDGEHERRIQEQNLAFQMIDDVEEVFRELYRKPRKWEAGTWKSPTEMVRDMHRHYRGVAENASSLRRLGSMLKRNGFEYRRTNRSMEYWVIQQLLVM